MINLNLKIPQNFLDTEIRNGYLISREQKEIWAIELDLLHQVQQICKKYNIKYLADGGTLLGAVRHGGFIPWDDDIDIMMLREDYDKFIEVAKKELKEPYFLQTDWTDKVFYCHAKLRRSDTTCILEKDLKAKFDFNQGIFIDIFPFDNVPDNEIDYRKFVDHLWILKNELLAARSRWWLYKKDDTRLWNRCLELRDEYEQLRRSYNNKNTKSVANLGLPSLKNDIRKMRVDFNSFISAKFEHIKINIPTTYHAILSRLYGEYMKPVMGKSKHGKLLFDTHTSYKDTQMLK